MAAALRGSGAFRTPMMVQVVTVAINIVLAPILIFGWGTGVAFGVQRRRHRLARGDRRRRGVADACSSSSPRRSCASRAADAPAPAGGLGPAPRHRPAGRRRVQPDGGLHVPRLRGGAAVRIGGPGRLRHRPAPGAGDLPAGRGARRSRWRRWPARTSARGASIACARRCSPALGLAVGADARRRPWSASSPPRRWSASSRPIPAVIARRRRLPAHHRLGLRGSGIVFVSSSIFQALGRTLPPLLTSLPAERRGVRAGPVAGGAGRAST